MSKTEREIRNFILKTNTFIAAMAFLLSACLIDTDSLFAPVICFISLAWLSLFYYANKERIERMAKE